MSTVLAPVNIYFLESFSSSIPLDSAPWIPLSRSPIKTIPHSSLFLRLSLSFCIPFLGPDSTWLWRGQHLRPWPQAGRLWVRVHHLSIIYLVQQTGLKASSDAALICHSFLHTDTNATESHPLQYQQRLRQLLYETCSASGGSFLCWTWSDAFYVSG